MPHAALQKQEQKSSFQVKPRQMDVKSRASRRPQSPEVNYHRNIGNMAVQRLTANQDQLQDAPTEDLGGMETPGGTAQLYDFSDVRIHKDSPSAVSLGALAYTRGNDIHFAPGQYNLNSSSGRRILTHELGHVVQQREGRVHPTTSVAGVPVNDDSKLEREAEGRVPSISQSGSRLSNVTTVQRRVFGQKVRKKWFRSNVQEQVKSDLTSQELGELMWYSGYPKNVPNKDQSGTVEERLTGREDTLIFDRPKYWKAYKKEWLKGEIKQTSTTPSVEKKNIETDVDATRNEAEKIRDKVMGDNALKRESKRWWLRGITRALELITSVTAFVISTVATGGLSAGIVLAGVILKGAALLVKGLRDGLDITIAKYLAKGIKPRKLKILTNILGGLEAILTIVSAILLFIPVGAISLLIKLIILGIAQLIKLIRHYKNYRKIQKGQQMKYGEEDADRLVAIEGGLSAGALGQDKGLGKVEKVKEVYDKKLPKKNIDGYKPPEGISKESSFWLNLAAAVIKFIGRGLAVKFFSGKEEKIKQGESNRYNKLIDSITGKKEGRSRQTQGKTKDKRNDHTRGQKQYNTRYALQWFKNNAVVDLIRYTENDQYDLTPGVFRVIDPKSKGNNCLIYAIALTTNNRNITDREVEQIRAKVDKLPGVRKGEYLEANRFVLRTILQGLKVGPYEYGINIYLRANDTENSVAFYRRRFQGSKDAHIVSVGFDHWQALFLT